MFKSSITRRLHQDVRLVYSSSSSSSPSSFLFKMYHSEHLEKSISVGARQIPFILPCAIVIIIDVITCSLTSRHSHSHSLLAGWLGKWGLGTASMDAKNFYIKFLCQNSKYSLIEFSQSAEPKRTFYRRRICIYQLLLEENISND